MSQRQVLRALYERYRVAGSPLPSLRELAEDTGLCKSAVYSSIKALEASGLLTWKEWLARTLKPTADGIMAAQGYRIVWRTYYG